MSVEAYHRQIQAAREVGLGLTRSQAEAYRLILEAYAEELASRIGAGIGTRDQRFLLDLVTEILEQMVRDLARSTRQGVVIALDRIVGLQTAATLELLASQGSALAVSFQGLGTATAQAWLSRPVLSQAFKTIRRDSIATADRIIGSALVRGASSVQLGRELRGSIIGSEGLPTDILVDRRRIGYAAIRRMGYLPTPENLRRVKRQASKVAMRAQLIARTEIMGAQHELGGQLAMASPVVAAIQWFLSHRHVVPDVCDVLANADLYGMGAGMYHPERLPSRPHPRCMCGHRHVLRPVEDWDKPREAPPRLKGDPQRHIDRLGLPPSQGRSLRASINAGRRKPLAVPDDPEPSLAEAIAKREDEIRTSPVEWATAWDPKTGKQVLNKTSNNPSYVEFEGDELLKLKDTIFTHNHPSSSSFSRADMRATFHWEVAELRVASRKYDYRLKRPESGWPDIDEVMELAATEERKLFDEIGPRFRAGELTEIEAIHLHSHQLWTRVFQQLGLGHIYERKERSE